jgi:chorismate mutase
MNKQERKLELVIEGLESWVPRYSHPLIIAGPCGAENEKQVLETAEGISKLGRANIFRAGIWKPRTRPGTFEGAGIPGLSWLQEVKNRTGLLTTVEVASTEHVEAALKNKVDILWIGARTTVNPFMVQEIAEALTGIDIPVMVKNPVTPDLLLWIGALERINKAGIKKLVAIHRGFHTYEKSNYRNAPKWELPIELKRMFPNLPVICDISHISGRPDLLRIVAQKALDLDFAGLMIETHINPKEALSDAEQQITPETLSELLNSLVIRKSTSTNKDFISRLEQLRSVIDELDEEIIHSIAKRMEISEKIGECKRDNNVAILQVSRWEEVISRLIRLGEKKGLSKEFMKQLLQLVHIESIRKQSETMNEDLREQELNSLAKINDILNNFE